MLYLLHPSHSNIIGGVESLFHLLGVEFENIDFEFGLIDFNDSCIKNKLIESKVNFKFIELPSNLHQTLDYEFLNDDIILTSNYTLKTLHFRISSTNVKYIFWDVYSPFWRGSLSRFKNNSNVKKLLTILVEKNSILPMDTISVQEINRFSNVYIGTDKIMPIAVSLDLNIDVKNGNLINNQSGIFKLFYIGRAVIWKITPVIKLLEDLSEINEVFLFSIFTDNENEFKAKIPQKIIDNDKIKILFYEGFAGEVLHNKISSMDIGFAMGTAALEISSCRVPCVLLDCSSIQFPQSYGYRWFGEDNSIGVLGQMLEFCEGSEIYKIHSKSISNILDDFKRDKNRVIDMNIHALSIYDSKLIAGNIVKMLPDVGAKRTDLDILFSGFLGKVYYLLLRCSRKLFPKKYIW